MPFSVLPLSFLKSCNNKIRIPAPSLLLQAIDLPLQSSWFVGHVVSSHPQWSALDTGHGRYRHSVSCLLHFMVLRHWASYSACTRVSRYRWHPLTAIAGPHVLTPFIPLPTQQLQTIVLSILCEQRQGFTLASPSPSWGREQYIYTIYKL